MTATTEAAFPLSVGEVAAEAQVTRSAVRFYEQHGLISAHRTISNHRRFSSGTPCLIRVAKVCQRAGLTVREIAEQFASLPADPQPGDWERFARRLVAEAEQRVTELRTLLTDLGSDTKLCDIPG